MYVGTFCFAWILQCFKTTLIQNMSDFSSFTYLAGEIA